jgi:hypothetical protein
VQRFDHPSVKLAQTLEFAGFVSHPMVQESFRRSSASSYMRHADGTVQCACFIRLEHFEQDAQPLFHHLGFALDLPVANRSTRKRDYRGYYSTRTAEAIAGCCAADIAQFGYTFDG